MRRSRHGKPQVDAGFLGNCLDVLTVFTNERVRVDGDMRANARDAVLVVDRCVVASSGGGCSRRSRRAREISSLAAMTASRPWTKVDRDGIVTLVKTTQFDGDAA